MLYLDVKPGEQVLIGDAIVEVRELRSNSVRLAIEADRERVPVELRGREAKEEVRVHE